ncbi:response regulator transcription factor [Petrachloros mirabilis]
MQHLFIIDDDTHFGKSLRRLLNCKGFQTEYFSSAQSFLDAVPSGQNGIAIVDVHMPMVDGFSLIGKMRELRYSMPVIVITGQTEVDSRDIAMQMGAIGFLQKPFNEQSLMDLIEAHSDDNGAMR